MYELAGKPGREPCAEAALDAALRPAWAEVDLDALGRNFDRLAARVRPARVLAVVKADAYGHGAVAVARRLEAAGADWLGVALVEEGAELRRAGVGLPILVLGTVQPSQLEAVCRHRLTPAVSSRQQLAMWIARAGDSAAAGSAPQPVHLKIDTGMSRLGLVAAELGAALTELRATPGLALAGVMTHFAEADEPAAAANRRQQELFAAALGALTADERERVLVHCANSAAALHLPASRCDLVRLGLALYGVDPVGAIDSAGSEAAGELEPAVLEPVLSLRARLVQVREVPAGTAVGYGGRWVAPRPSRLGVVPMGYADGYPWRLGIGGAEVLVGGVRVPVVGAVSMDMLTVDLTGSGAGLGDEVTLLGRQGGETITVRELARGAGTIPYEVLVLAALRLPRRVREGGGGVSG